MPRPSSSCRVVLFVAGALALAGLAPAQQATVPKKRPLKHSDYDAWGTLQAPVLSRDGRYFAYNS